MKYIPTFLTCATLAAIAALINLRGETSLDSGTPELNNLDPIVENPDVVIGFDFPLCDNNVNSGDSIPVYAGFETHILGTYGSWNDGATGLIGVGAQASITNPHLVEKIEWKIEPLRPLDEQGCDLPKLLDQLNPGPPAPATDWTEVSRDVDFSAIVIDYLYNKGNEQNPELSARAGDSFKISCRVKGPMGYKEADDPIFFHIVPGPKQIHVAIDTAVDGREQSFVADIDNYEKMAESEFVSSFKDYRILTPAGREEKKEFVVYCFDRFRNPLEEGEDVAWRLNGGGMLGTPEASQPKNNGIVPGDSSAVHNTTLAANGRASITFTQITYPTCPFSPEFDGDLKSAVEIIVNEDHFEAGISKVSTDNLPVIAQVKGVNLKTIMGSWEDPKIDLFETRQFQVSAVLLLGENEIPLAGLNITAFSTNGALSPRDGKLVTDEQGNANVTLTSSGAIVGDVEVIASFSNESVLLTPLNARWTVSEGHPYLTYEHRIIAGNRTTDGAIFVDTLDDAGESLHPEGGVEGDGLLRVGVYHGSHVTVHGEPNHEYTFNGSSSANKQTAGYDSVVYSFEEMADNGETSATSPSECGLYSAYLIPAGSSIESKQTVEVPGPPAETASEIVPHRDFRLHTQEEIQFYDPLANLPLTTAGTECSFYFATNATATTATTTKLLDRRGPGIYLKRFPATGKCRVDLSFSVNVEGSPATLEKRTIQSVEFDDVPRRWFRVRVSSHANRILLFVTQAATTGDGGFLPDSEGVARDPGGYLAGHTDGKAYHLQSGETFSSLVLLSPSRLNPEPYETGVTQEMILYDMVEFRKSDPTEGLGNFQVEVLSAEFEAQPLSEYNTFTTDENGIAILYISSKGRMADEDYIPDILDFELTGSTTFFGRLFATADWFNARMVQCGKAVLTGTEGLGSGAGWHEKAVAWASEVIPFASDLRTLAFEIYKGASGCDNVNWYNVGFSAISLVADCFTLGAAKGITAPLKLGVLGGKALLKSMAVSVVVGSGLEVAGNALAGYMERIGKEAAKQADDTPAWAGRAGGFLNFVEAKRPEGTQTDFGRNFFGAMGSVNDVDDLAKTHDTLGEGEFVEFMAMEVPEDIK